MIKSILISFVICFFVVSASAQVEKNAIYPEFSMGRKFFYYNTNSFQGGVSIGLNSHSTAGVFYSRTRYNSMPSNLYNYSHTVSNRVGIAYTYYNYFKNSAKWGWSLNGSLSYNRSYLYEKTTAGTASTRRYNETELTVTPGVFFQPTSRIMLTGNIGGFTLLNSRYQPGTTRSSFAGELNLGIRIMLKKNKKK